MNLLGISRGRAYVKKNRIFRVEIQNNVRIYGENMLPYRHARQTSIYAIIFTIRAA